MPSLLYKGNKSNGISIMMFKSYKRVWLKRLEPYRMTSADNQSADAIEYYNSLNKLGVFFIPDKVVAQVEEPQFNVNPMIETQGGSTPPEDTGTPNESNEVQSENPAPQEIKESELPKETEINGENLNEQPEQNAPITEPTTPVVNSSAFKSELSKQELDEMVEGELVEYLDMNYPEDLTPLIQAVGYAPGNRKHKSSILSDMVSKKRAEVIVEITK